MSCSLSSVCMSRPGNRWITSCSTGTEPGACCWSLCRVTRRRRCLRMHKQWKRLGGWLSVVLFRRFSPIMLRLPGKFRQRWYSSSPSPKLLTAVQQACYILNNIDLKLKPFFLNCWFPNICEESINLQILNAEHCSWVFVPFLSYRPLIRDKIRIINCPIATCTASAGRRTHILGKSYHIYTTLQHGFKKKSHSSNAALLL